MSIIQNPVLARDADNTIDLNTDYLDLNLKAKNLADDVVAFAEAAAADLVGFVQGLMPLDTIAATTYTITAADHGKLLFFTAGTAVTVTVPQQSAEAVPVPFHCGIIQAGAGQVSLVAQGADALNSLWDSKKLMGQWAMATLVKRAPGLWWLGGGLG